MIEWTQRELLARTKLSEQGGDSFAVFIYTPLCGTCKVAERMLQVIAALRPELALFKSNIHFMPTVAADWQIRSVPCIVVVRGGAPQARIYRMQSVDGLDARLTELLAP